MLHTIDIMGDDRLKNGYIETGVKQRNLRRFAFFIQIVFGYHCCHCGLASCWFNLITESEAEKIQKNL